MRKFFVRTQNTLHKLATKIAFWRGISPKKLWGKKKKPRERADCPLPRPAQQQWKERYNQKRPPRPSGGSPSGSAAAAASRGFDDFLFWFCGSAGRVLVCGGVSRRTCIKDKHTPCYHNPNFFVCFSTREYLKKFLVYAIIDKKCTHGETHFEKY